MTGPPRRTVTRALERAIRWGTLAVLVEAVRERNPNAVANAAVMFPATFLPEVVERLYGVRFRPWQRAYAKVAMLAHAVGFLGPYDDTWWWDHLTHVLSASLLGGAVHVAARRRGRDPRRDVLGAVVAGGLVWEAAEYAIHRASDRLGVEPMLVVYGRADTAKDLLFNLVGALVVLAFGDRLLRNLTGDDPGDDGDPVPESRRGD